MVGIPGSGKSTIVNYLSKLKSDLIILQPELLYGGSSDNTVKMAAWDTCIEQLKEEIFNIDSTVILDTCGTNKDVMFELADKSIELGHNVAFIVVNTNIDLCKERNLYRKVTLSDHVMNEYKNKLLNMVRLLSEKSGRYKVIVTNTNTKDDVKSGLKKILSYING